MELTSPLKVGSAALEALEPAFDFFTSCDELATSTTVDAASSFLVGAGIALLTPAAVAALAGALAAGFEAAALGTTSATGAAAASTPTVRAPGLLVREKGE